MIHKIENGFIEVQIKEFGAELCSLKKKNDDYEYMWQADEKYWARHSPILFPIVGKLIDDEYIYNNKKYKMTQHGFARDCLFKVFDKKTDEIIFRLQSSTKTLEMYPFKFEFFIQYKLTKNTLIIGYKVINHSDNKMFFSIGAHPAFNWPFENKNKTQEYYLQFQNTVKLERLPLTSLGISSDKKFISLENNKLKLNRDLFKDDALVLENLETKSIVFKNNENYKDIEITFDNFPFLGIWSKPTGAPFLCIEPWYGIADFIGHTKQLEEKKGILSLNINQIYESNFQITI